MKKTYSRPETTLFAVKTHQMVCTSLSATNVEGLGYGGETSGTVTEGASRRSFWDDEE